MGDVKDTNNTSASVVGGIRTETQPCNKVVQPGESCAEQADWKRREAESQATIQPLAPETANVATPQRSDKPMN